MTAILDRLGEDIAARMDELTRLRNAARKLLEAFDDEYYGEPMSIEMHEGWTRLRDALAKAGG